MQNEWLAGIRFIDELPLKDKRVLMRLDLNVPIKDGKVTDDTRIREALPTIQYAMSKGSRIVLMSHLGRPNGVDPEFSLAPVAEHLSLLLNTDVMLTDDCVGDGVEMIVKQLKISQVVLLENLRFHPEEEKNDPEFARQLANHGDIYINDAFGTAHRAHASTVGVPQIMPVRGSGFLIKKELDFLGRLLTKPATPYVVILGGSKVADKIKTIENLYMLADTILIGGAMGNTFRAAQGHELPKTAKQPKSEEIQHAKALIEKARKQEVNLVLPVDDVDSFDIGPKTVELFTNEIAKAKTIFWNGPVGMFEKTEYATGTFAVAQAVATSRALKVVGGGDTVSAVNKAGVAAQIDHISTGGGATLEFLEGKGLPGINILKTWARKLEPQQGNDGNSF